jgi:hypothetical protein
MRRLVISASLVALLLTVASPGVQADTTTQPANVYVVGGAFSFVDGGREWSGWAQVEDDRMRLDRHASFYFAADGDESTCDAGTPDDASDDYVGLDYLEFTPTSTTIVDFSVRTDLSAAKFELRMAGTLLTVDGCSGEIVQTRRERHSFTMSLKGTSDLFSETNSVIIDNGDGTYGQGTDTYSFRTAAGKASVDKASAVVSDARISHVVVVQTS